MGEREIMKQTTPKKISSSIKQFIRDAGLKGKAQYLHYTGIAPEYYAGYCLDNCEAEQMKTNCKIVYGWIIWQDKKRHFIEAEFHAVVKKDDKLVDITPRVDGEAKILFLEDLERKPKRIDDHTWQSWTNIKMQDGNIYEQCQTIKLQNMGLTISEKQAQGIPYK